MNQLGASSSKPSDWKSSTGYYSRMTIHSSTRISRPANQFPTVAPPVHPFDRRAGASNRDHLRLFTTELLDLGHCDSNMELCEYLLQFQIDSNFNCDLKFT